MSIRRVVPDIASDHFDESRQFYADVLGFKVVMNLGSVAIAAQVTIEVADVDAVYNEAARRGTRILFPPRDESWGVRRFFLLDLDDVVINVMSHRPGRPAES